MSKEDIINKLKLACSSQDVEITKSDLSKVFDALMKIIKGKLDEEGEIRLHGIGTFSTAISQEKQCRNPQNGEIMTVPQKTRVKFKASQTLLSILNKEKEEVVS
ncbi:HU family DNA-binding protein [Wolbachia endosymbiont of Litomosoides brasiliensis]|uniref:HU family DNA-binding protein n=1 Tax=Wolbachia endosymbiont of Litomosoides brasiliensis TaxID=1812117 RepID=UPI00158CE9D1|nr:HU family DNA-binding protein [Wolbachia endosymbiont of Litomosoides brasiliensis]NUY39629.1 HU family DNA-binding protein [Wolbachia endosymbiont of Litomosoides brasiliensis]